MQTDLGSMTLMWAKKVVFPTYIGKVSWLKPNVEKKTSYAMLTGKKTEIEVPIKYNTKVGTVDHVHGNQTLHFKITMQFVNATFHKTDVKQFEQTQEDERQKRENNNNLEAAKTLEDLKNRQQQAEFAESQSERDLEVAGAPAAIRAQEKVRRENRKIRDERSKQDQWEEFDDGEDDMEIVQDDPARLARDKERAKTFKQNEKFIAARAKLEHQNQLEAIRGEAKKRDLKLQEQRELDAAKAPAKPGLWQRMNFWSRPDKDEDKGNKTKDNTGKKVKVQKTLASEEDVEQEESLPPQKPPPRQPPHKYPQYIVKDIPPLAKQPAMLPKGARRPQSGVLYTRPSPDAMNANKTRFVSKKPSNDGKSPGEIMQSPTPVSQRTQHGTSNNDGPEDKNQPEIYDDDGSSEEDIASEPKAAQAGWSRVSSHGVINPHGRTASPPSLVSHQSKTNNTLHAEPRSTLYQQPLPPNDGRLRNNYARSRKSAFVRTEGDEDTQDGEFDIDIEDTKHIEEVELDKTNNRGLATARSHTLLKAQNDSTVTAHDSSTGSSNASDKQQRSVQTSVKASEAGDSKASRLGSARSENAESNDSAFGKTSPRHMTHKQRQSAGIPSHPPELPKSATDMSHDDDDTATPRQSKFSQATKERVKKLLDPSRAASKSDETPQKNKFPPVQTPQPKKLPPVQTSKKKNRLSPAQQNTMPPDDTMSPPAAQTFGGMGHASVRPVDHNGQGWQPNGKIKPLQTAQERHAEQKAQEQQARLDQMGKSYY